MRLSARAWLVLGAALGILIVLSTDQVVPATSAYQAQMRVWLAGRATGITAYLLLTGLVSLGLILSHPMNQSTWKLSKRLFPWHENLFVFDTATAKDLTDRIAAAKEKLAALNRKIAATARQAAAAQAVVVRQVVTRAAPPSQPAPTPAPEHDD
jgi:hypothetical protein